MSNTKKAEEDRKQIHIREVLRKLEAQRQRLLFKDISASDDFQQAIRVIRNLRARLAMYSKTLQAARTQVMAVHDGLEDEGDRVYLGSTNDAERFKNIFQALDSIQMEVYMSDGDLPDVYAVAREANNKLHEAAHRVNARIEEIDVSGASNEQEAQILKDAAIDAVTEALKAVPIPKDDSGVEDVIRFGRGQVHFLDGDGRQYATEEFSSAVFIPIKEPEKKIIETLTISYTNWRGETSLRRIIPKGVRYGSTPWHPEPQWLLLAWDEEKRATREFAMKDFGPGERPGGATVPEAGEGPGSAETPS